jgi:diaminopimelate epimerase
MSGEAVRFEKWEGLGNDFVVLEGAVMTAASARRLCERRLGVGADGVLVVGRAPARMDVWNADGSRPEMCGNGLRCVAGYLAERGAPAEMDVVTFAGTRRCEVAGAGEDRYEVTVEMGVARIDAPLVVGALGREHRFLRVDVGNPHAVTFEPTPEDVIEVLGPRVAAAPPGGFNVEFCRATTPGRIEVTVWERGVGRTQACGTGACAAAAAACEIGLAPYGAPIEVVLPGGALSVTVAAGTRALTMRGPARRVFSGEVVIA